jgi:hypothetical protein
LGEKPTLWDMWTRREEEKVTINLKWENITVRQAPQSVSTEHGAHLLLACRSLAFLRHAVLPGRRASSAESHRATTPKFTPFVFCDGEDVCF